MQLFRIFARYFIEVKILWDQFGVHGLSKVAVMENEAGGEMN